ncbi:MAG TPA: type II secretion system F family protein [Deltaproteobacteria bacterium]|nr:type II secretion system F family protein [Candidatus Binatota bacterium]HIL13201.1 type II secretion system F family protein [Deltaproteobacteria bacterium]
MTPLLISLGAALGGGLFFSGVVLALRSRRDMQRRLAVALPAEGVSVLDDEEQQSFVSRLLSDVGAWVADTFGAPADAAATTKDNSDSEKLLSAAGWRGPRAVALYAGARMGLALSLAFIAAIGALVSGGELSQAAQYGACGGLLGYFIPRFVVGSRANKRRLLITRTLPDVVDMFVLCVEAGLGLNAAMKRVGDERSRDPDDVLGRELSLMNYQLASGRSREDAFLELGRRNDAEDLKAFSSFMVQSDKLGTNIADALRVFAGESRSRRKQMAQEAANKAAVKLLFPLVLFIFPTMFLVILGPAIMKLQAAMP